MDGRKAVDPEFPIIRGRHVIAIDGVALESVAAPVHLMLNKPRGLVTSTRDEQGRDTVYRCFDGAGLPWLAPVGRLDKASEGLLFFSNDPQWAASITDPRNALHKCYHVQIDRLPDVEQLSALRAGRLIDGEMLKVADATELRRGQRNAWLRIVLDEGRNRQIRRLLHAFDIGVLRLIRTAIGPVQLGDLGKGQWRFLTAQEVAAVSAGSATF